MSIYRETKALVILLYRLSLFALPLVNATITFYIFAVMFIASWEEARPYYFAGLAIMAILTIWGSLAVELGYSKNQFLFCNIPIILLLLLFFLVNSNKSEFIFSCILPFIFSITFQYFVIKFFIRKQSSKET
jgi:Na+/melibiose symporter-like transporter